MWLINTSYGWNPGDDLIREGVFNLLRLSQVTPKVFVNRGQTKVNDKTVPIWKILRNFESTEHLVSQATGIIMAGSPEWVDFFEDFYIQASAYNVPIYMVGIGMRSVSKDANNLVNSVKHLIKGATVRDKHASAALKSCGIESQWFPDPAFSASYTIPTSKRYGLVVNYRSHGGNGTFKDTYDDKWREIAKKYESDIEIVTVHEQGEYKKAKKIFSSPVFYSSDYTDYKYIYSNTKLYIGGRIHGATPVLSTGGTAYLIYNSPKIDALQKVSKFMDTLKVLNFNSPVPDISYIDSTLAIKRLQEYIQQHKRYWELRL